MKKKTYNKKSINRNLNKNKQETEKQLIKEEKFSKKYLLFLLAILVSTFIALSPSLNNEFTNWDDNGYVIDNEAIRNLNIDTLLSMFKSYEMGNYHPFTMLSLAIDYQLAGKVPPENFGDPLVPKADIFHLHNLILHLINTALVFWIVWLLAKLFIRSHPLARSPKYGFALPLAVITSFIFGLNTMHVESIAWVSERKDVLYSMYFILSMGLYLIYIQKNKTSFLILSLIAFVFSLLSKGQAVSLAVSIIAIDYLLKRKFNTKVIIEKMLFIIPALIIGIVAINAQKEGEAIHNISEYPFYERLAYASYSYVMYLFKLLIPVNLAAVYPYPHPFDGGMPVYYWLFVPLTGGIVFIMFKALKKNNLIGFSLIFYSVNIFLLLQFLPVGSAVMADRYSYIPSIGFCLLIAFLIVKLTIKNPQYTKAILFVLPVYLLFLGVRTFVQSDIWKDSITLWDHTLKISPRAVVVWNNRGSAKDKKDDKKGAIADFTEAIRLKPDYSHAIYNRGTAFKDEKQYKLALIDFNRAIEIDPDFMEAYHNRGITRENLNDIKGAIEDYNKALSIKEQPNLYAARGVAKGKSQRLKEAIKDFNISISMKKQNPEAYSNRGFAKVLLGQVKEGIKDYDIAISINPKSQEPIYNRAIAYTTIGDTTKAIAGYKRLFELDNKHFDGNRNLAYIYRNKKQYNKALELYNKLEKYYPKNTKIMYDKGGMLYELKRWQEALAEYNKILEIEERKGSAYYYKAMILINTNKKEEACKNFHNSAKYGIKEAKAAINKYCK